MAAIGSKQIGQGVLGPQVALLGPRTQFLHGRDRLGPKRGSGPTKRDHEEGKPTEPGSAG